MKVYSEGSTLTLNRCENVYYLSDSSVALFTDGCSSFYRERTTLSNEEEAGRAPETVWTVMETDNFIFLSGFETWSVQPVASRYIVSIVLP